MSTLCSRRGFLGRAAALAGALCWTAGARPAWAAADDGPARPLLVVHGFADQIATWYRPDNNLVARLAEAGYRWDRGLLVPFAYPPLAGAPGGEDSQGDIAVAGAALARAIRSTAQQAGGQVDLLGFSMGGLTCRWAINSLRAAEGALPLVNTAVLIATPNRGVDVLLWLNQLGQGIQTTLQDMARQLANLNVESAGARQMLPDSEFLGQLNRPELADDRVRYALIAGQAQLSIQAGPISRTLGVGDGVISSGSASYLPGLPAQVYTIAERLGDSDEPPWQTVQRSRVFHPRLMFNDDVALATVAELLPGASAPRAELQARVGVGEVEIAARR